MNKLQKPAPSLGIHSSGFSLLEVLVAVAVMAISFLAITQYQGQAMSRVRRTQNLTVATFLAREKMAEALLEIQKEHEQQKVFPEDKEESGSFEDPFQLYRWEWHVRKVAIPMPKGVGEEDGDSEGGEGGETPPAGIQTIVFKMVNDHIKDAIREVKTKVIWDENGKEREIEVITHITKL